MTTLAADPRQARRSATAHADVLVIFGITGDLAKVMTFRSLYRLEQRGLLDCPIVGVAGDDWSVDDLKQRAHQSIGGAGEKIDGKIFDRPPGALSHRAGRFFPPPRPPRGGGPGGRSKN